MKRCLYILFLMTLTAVLPARAQGSLWGFKGGINTTDLNFDRSVFDTKYRCGWFFGPSVKINLPIHVIAFDVSALYEQRESKLGSTVVRQKSIVVPANLRFNFGLGDLLGLYLAAGPQLGFNVGKEKFEVTDDSAPADELWLKRAAFSFNLGAGLFLTDHLEVGVAYNIAMGTTGDITLKKAVSTLTSKDTYTAESQAKTWMLSAAVYF